MAKQVKQVRLPDGSFFVDINLQVTIQVPDESCLASDRAIAEALGSVLADELPRNIIEASDHDKAADALADYLHTYTILDVEENIKATANELKKQIKENLRMMKV